MSDIVKEHIGFTSEPQHKDHCIECLVYWMNSYILNSTICFVAKELSAKRS